jgi:Domain of unknown function (DUF222)
MSRQVSSTLEGLASAIDHLELPVDSGVLTDAFTLADRLNAKLLAAVGEHDTAELWRNDGATSMIAWLRHHTRRSGRDAAHWAKTARRLRQLPVTAAAYRDGVLSSGQVQAIVANLKDRTAGLFAHHETEPVPELAALSVADTAIAMQDWARRADAAVGDDPEPVLPDRSLHLSRILDGRRELSGSFDPEGGAVIATALRLAATSDVDGEPARSPAQRRGDALVDVCRWFLDHQQHRRGGRHRPHLNVVASLDDLEQRGQGRLLDGSILDAATVQRLFCDAASTASSPTADPHLGLRHHHPHRPRQPVQRPGHPRPPLPVPRLRPAPRMDRNPPPRWVTHGGPTALDNLTLQCTRHHHLLHSPGWHAKLLPDATSS